MDIYLEYPQNHSHNVDPMTRIDISFDGFLLSENITIFVDSEKAFDKGTVQKKFKLIRFSNKNNKTKITLRPLNPLPQRDIYVKAITDCGSISLEQRFFVRGAKYRIKKMIGKRCFGGYFPKTMDYAFENKIEFNASGRVLHKGKILNFKCPLNPVNIDIRDTEIGLVGMTSKDSRTYLLYSKKSYKLNGDARDINIGKKFINYSQSKNTSFHIPLGDIPENTDDVKWNFYHEGSWDMLFSENMHVWFNDSEAIVKRNPNPLTGESDDLLWTSNDIESSFNKIEIIDKDHIFVNDTYYLNTKIPKISRL